MLRWVGTWSGRRAVLVLFGAALLGLIGTVLIGHDPGFLIGFFLLIGSVAAAIGAQRRVYQLIPLPALSYFVVTTIAGYMHDRSVLNGAKEWATNFLTWIGSAFLALVWATVLVAVIAIARWVIDRRQATGQPSAATTGGTAGRATMSASARPDPWSGRGPLDRPSRPGGRGPQPGRDARGADRDSFADRSPGGNAFEADSGNPWGDRGPRDSRNPRESRDSRDSRDDRDSWGEPAPRRDRDLNRGQRDDRGQDPYSGPRDDRRPPPKTPPRDLW